VSEDFQAMMCPEDVPDELVDLFNQAEADACTNGSSGKDAARAGFAAMLTAHKATLRAEFAQEIKSFVEAAKNGLTTIDELITEVYDPGPQAYGDRTILWGELSNLAPDLRHAADLGDSPFDLYRERAHLIAALAAVYPAVIAYSDEHNPEWPVIYVYLSQRTQVSWHLNKRDLDLFEHVQVVDKDHPDAEWDGHTTEEKYELIAQFAKRRSALRKLTRDWVDMNDETFYTSFNRSVEELNGE